MTLLAPCYVCVGTTVRPMVIALLLVWMQPAAMRPMVPLVTPCVRLEVSGVCAAAGWRGRAVQARYGSPHGETVLGRRSSWGGRAGGVVRCRTGRCGCMRRRKEADTACAGGGIVT